MIERSLLYFFTQSAHLSTRGTFTTPESTTLDQDGYTYVAVPLALKWMLCFEEPQPRTLWLGKTDPRDWLVQGGAPLVADSLTTRYGRILFQLEIATSKAGVHTVRANVTLPIDISFATSGPAGGIRLRARAPLDPEHAGKLSSVAVGGCLGVHLMQQRRRSICLQQS